MEIAFSKPYVDEREIRSASEVIQSGWLVSGPMVQRFEEEIAEYCGVREAVCVSSWTTGAFLLLSELGIGAGDDVIVPSSTFIASVNVIRHVGAKPIFLDIDYNDWNLDISSIESLITSRTKAIIAVEQLGQPYDGLALNDLCKRRNLFLINDAACSIGSRVGNLPSTQLFDYSVVSFHARKIITTGEGGAILLRDSMLAKRLRQLRHQGMSINDRTRHIDPTLEEGYPIVGYNFRMTDIQAAIGIVQLGKVDEIIQRRRVIANHYDRFFADQSNVSLRFVPLRIVPNHQTYQFVLNHGTKVDRESLIKSMWKKGVPIKRGVMAVHKQEAYRAVCQGGVVLSNTERVADRGVQLPLHPSMTIQQADYVLECLYDLLQG